MSTPLSHRPLADIVHQYSSIPPAQLAAALSAPAAAADFRSEFIAAHEHRLTVAGVSLRVCHNIGAQTPAHTPLHCFVHGLGGNLEQFEPLLRATADAGRAFVALDLPGFGQSDASPGAVYPMLWVGSVVQQAVAAAWTEGRGGRDSAGDSAGTAALPPLPPLVLIGHSMGCYIALHLLCDITLPNAIHGLVLISPPRTSLPELDPARWSSAQAGLALLWRAPWLLDAYRHWWDQPRGLRSSGIAKFFADHSENDAEDIPRTYRLLQQFRNNLRTPSASVAGYLRGWRALDWARVRHCTGDCALPPLVLCGDADRVTPPADARAFAAELGGSAAFELVEGCGHNAPCDAPERVCALFSAHCFGHK
ncbi:triacylglycerol lipase [Maudiozyma humilis]|uniref:Triacylglycerol lipase n=1 Tax=Maudiozyma humilis TaxID=51915 RepID=A0AAV5S4C1_MAUHU|nr:triacylglycerol lipase [Kazachstania humilis]